MVIYNNNPSYTPTMADAPITLHEVERELKTLKSGKAPGIDGTSNDLYRYLSDYII